MNRLKVHLSAIALILSTAVSANDFGDGYSYLLMIDSEKAHTCVEEAVPAETFDRLSGSPVNCFFSPALNLSGLKNPVLRLWKFGMQPLTNAQYHTLLSYGKRYVRVSTPDVDIMTAMPTIDGIRFGANIYPGLGEIFTVGEMPANKDDIRITQFTPQFVKGESMGDEEIITMPSEDGTYSEAEIRFSATGLADLDQAYVHVNVGNGIDYCKNLLHGGELGQFECFAITPDGEIEMYYIGGEDDDSYFLLPANTQHIVLRFRSPFPEQFPIVTGNIPSRLISEVVQPGYHTVPELGFNINDLIGVIYGEFQSKGVVTIPHYDKNNVYDLNGDGIKEIVGSYNNTYIVGGFEPDLTRSYAVNSNFGSVLAFTGGSINTFGYDQQSIFSVDASFDRKNIYTADKPRFAFVDYDNNGRTDFLDLANNTIITLNANNEATVEHLKTLTLDEYLGIRPPGDNPLGSGMSVVGDTKTPPAVFASYVQTDINGDGYPDFVDATSGNYYMNLGDGRFVTDSFGGQLLFRDFDGDGINDFLFYDTETKTVSVTLQRIGSEAVVKKLISGYYCDGDIWIRDFDKDGDLDILMPFSAKANGGMAFLVMFENDGRGTFKKKEFVIDGSVDFAKCIDWNADGNYEVITHQIKDADKGATAKKFASFAIEGLIVNTDPDYIYVDFSGTSANLNRDWALLDVIDITGTGQHNFVIGDNDSASNPLVAVFDTPTNMRPQKPSAPQLNFDPESEELTITWPRGSDKETAAADLTYELRISSTPEGDDIMSAAATSDGKRRNVMRGNCGYELKRKFNTSSWPNGNIYVSLQTIDDSGLGSEFSEAAIFKNALLPAQFTIEAPVNVAVYEEIVLKAISDVSNLNVVWSAEGSEVLATSNSEGRMRFTTPGTKTISMTVSDGTGLSRTVTRDIDIYPIRFAPDSELPSVDWSADLDMDGIAEVHYNGQFYEGDKTGKYTKLKSLFNTRTYNYPITADINRDGMPDVIHSYGHLVNTGGKTMEDVTPDKFLDYDLYLPDLDNDGLRDVYNFDGYNKYVMKNTGNYSDFITVDNGSFNDQIFHDKTVFYDFNGDGLTDIYFLTDYPHFVGLSYGPTSNPLCLENLGNFRFRAHPLPTVIDDMKFGYWDANDFDGNGKVDFLCSNYDKEFFILWDNNERTSLGNLSIESDYYGYDFDNNGCNDLIISGGNGNVTVCLFNPDHTYTMVKDDRLWIRDEKPYLRSDGALGLNNAVIKCAPNEKPSAPTGLNAVIEENNQLVITWNAATDKETPSAALRYNLSVKHKNLEDEQSYIISPLNGGFNGVPVPNDAHLIGATRFPIPLMAMSPDEYEIKVQAVDSRMCPGDFSAPITVKVNHSGYTAPKETMVGSVVSITFSDGVILNDVNFGKDAVLESIMGQVAKVYWTTEGIKTITAGTLQFTILVHPYVDASFSLPTEVWGNTKVYLPADESYEHTWTIRGNIGGAGMVTLSTTEGERIDGSTIALLFTFNSMYDRQREVTHTITTPYGSSTFTATTNIKSVMATAIGIVDMDDESGKFCVRTTVDNEDVMEYVVYRETETTDKYEFLGYVLPGESFIDLTSQPTERSSRYTIKALLYYGESQQSQPHQPIHAMISKGINGEWNIGWNKYAGRNVTTYRILRGDDPSSMECIGEVSGNITSYSDYNAPQSTKCYAVETLIAKPSAAQAPSMGSSRASGNDNYWRSRSNTVWLDKAGVHDVTVDTNYPTDIFNMQGICIKRDATEEDVENLIPGFYIINGKKVYIMRH